MTVLWLYLIVTLIPSMASAGWTVFGVTLIALALGSIMMVPALDMGDAEYWISFYKKWFTRALVTLSISGVVGVVLPSQRELMVIVGGSALIEAAQSDRVKGIADQSLSVVEGWLKEQNTKETPK